MPLHGTKTFVGFGFGPIQAGLFVLEAFRSGNFGRIVIAEVLPELVRSVREVGGRFRLNIAQADGIEHQALGPIEMEDPAVEGDRLRLIEAIAEASEIATAVPSIRFYKSEGPGSIHRVLARGLEARAGRPVVIYAAENHNHAAEALEEAVLEEVSEANRSRVRSGTRFLNTVIGKMSAMIADPDRVAETGLETITGTDPRAFLVESFNRILISAVRFPAGTRFQRGIEVFEEKPDLLPFEEAKLHGHNAAHALAAYLGALRGCVRLVDLERVPGAVPFVRRTFLEEAGEALCRKRGCIDPLFTRTGFEAHVDDLMARMMNPHLGDLVERVARDPARKLAWEDRLVGTMRLCLSQGIVPRGFALGAAAGLLYHTPALRADRAPPEAALDEIWRGSNPSPEEKRRVVELVAQGLDRLRGWLGSGISPFEQHGAYTPRSHE